MFEIFIHICGWVGMALFVGAYYLVSYRKLDATGQMYQWMNLAGAVCLGINVFHQKAWPAFGLEVVWGSIAIFALAANQKKHNHQQGESK